LLIFRGFRRLIEALELIGLAVSELVAVLRDAGPASERLEALERSHHQFEATCEGLLLKAEGKLKAASNAEARERQLKKSYERDQFDGITPEGGEGSETGPVLHDDAPASEEERLSALRLGVAPSNKAAAQLAKWS